MNYRHKSREESEREWEEFHSHVVKQSAANSHLLTSHPPLPPSPPKKPLATLGDLFPKDDK